MLLGIDQGTTGTTVVAYDQQLRPIAHAYRALPNQYPRPGRVEQRAGDVLDGVVEATAEVLRHIGGPRAIDAVGLANQGESVVAWDTATGDALGPVLVWSDGRGARQTTQLREDGHAARVRALTGLELDPYFSASKMHWLLQHHAPVSGAAAAGRLRIGTLDSWLGRQLGGRHDFTDHATASRTQLFGLQRMGWDGELLDLFGVPAAVLAELRCSLGALGVLEHSSWGGALPWHASLVDQPAALAGNGCFAPSEVKVTYGTGCFVVVNAGTALPTPPAGLLASIAWSTPERTTFAFDGGVFSAGTAVNWLCSIGVVSDVAETAALANSVADSDGVRFLPALAGLGAPWWDNAARGVLSGITSGTTRAHVVRAVLDSIALRVRDVLEAAWAAGQPRPAALRVDGGLSRNEYLMQRQADLLGVAVERAASAEATARGAAALAGIGAGLLEEADVRRHLVIAARYEPRIGADEREQEYAAWRKWLQQARAVT